MNQLTLVCTDYKLTWTSSRRAMKDGFWYGVSVLPADLWGHGLGPVSLPQGLWSNGVAESIALGMGLNRFGLRSALSLADWFRPLGMSWRQSLTDGPLAWHGAPSALVDLGWYSEGARGGAPK